MQVHKQMNTSIEDFEEFCEGIELAVPRIDASKGQVADVELQVFTFRSLDPYCGT